MILSIELREAFTIPERVKKLTSSEWEVIIIFIHNFLAKYNNRITNLNKEEVKLDYENQYKQQIEELLKQVEQKDEEIKNVNEKHNTEIKQLEEHMINIRSMLEDQYKTTFEQREKDIEQTYTIKLKSIDDVKNTLNESLEKTKTIYENELNELRIKLDNANVSLSKQYEEKLDYERKILNSKIEQYEEKLQNERIELEKLKNSFKIEIDNANVCLSKQYEEKLDYERKILNSKIEQYEEKLQNERKMINMELQHNKDLIDKLDRIHTDNLNKSTNLEMVVNNLQSSLSVKTSALNTFQQGKNGEDYVKELLHNKFTDGIIEDTSGQTARGDLLFQWRNMKCLVEIKNKVLLSQKEDMDKFIRDVHESKPFINCAVFVSLRTNTFPKRPKENIQLDYINGVPVFYVFLENENILYNVILLLSNQVKINESATTETEEIAILKMHLKNYYGDTQSDYKRIEKLIIVKKREISLLENMKKDIEKRIAVLQQDYCKYNEDHESKDNDIDIEIIGDKDVSINNMIIEAKQDEPITLDVIKKCYITNAERGNILSADALCKALHITDQRLKGFGGYERIIKGAQFDYMLSVIPKETHNKIVALKQQRGTFPKRADLMKANIMTDHDIRKIGHVLNVRNVMKSIETFCNEIVYPDL